MASGEDGLLLMAFHIYDAQGSLVADSEGLSHYPDGVSIRCAEGELLLDVPADGSNHVQYCLYNGEGKLLTWSDGARTKIGPLLRMEGVGRNWMPPAAAEAGSLPRGRSTAS